MYDIQKIRADFPILSREVYGKPLVYLDNGATTQKPRCVVDAITDEYYSVNANVHRGVHFLSQQATELHEASRETGMESVHKVSRSGTFTVNVKTLLDPYTSALISVPPVNEILSKSFVAKNTFLSYFTSMVISPLFTLAAFASGVVDTSTGASTSGISYSTSVSQAANENIAASKSVHFIFIFFIIDAILLILSFHINSCNHNSITTKYQISTIY